MIGSYKQCKTAEQLNAYTREERLTRCGFSHLLWSQSGSYQTTKNGWRDSFIHTKQNTCRDKEELKKVLTREQVEVLRNTFCENLQLSDVLINMQKELSGD